MGLSAARMGLFTSACSFGYLASSAPGGRLADMFGARWVMFLGLMLGAIPVICLLFAADFLTVLIVLFVAGLGIGCVFPATSRAVMDWFPANQRGLVVGTKSTGFNMAGMLTAATLPTVALHYGWRVGYMLLGVAGFIVAMIILGIYRDPKEGEGERVNRAKAEASAADKAMKKGSWIELFKSTDEWLLFLAAMANNGVTFCIVTYFVIYLRDVLLVPIVMAGFHLSFLDLGGLVGKVGGGFISDRLLGGKRKSTYIAQLTITLVVAGSLVVLHAGASRSLLAVLTFLFGFGCLGCAAVQQTLVMELAGQANSGLSIGALSSFNQLGAIFFVPVFGVIVDRTHSYGWAWGYVMGLTLAAIIMIAFVRERKK